MEELIKKGLPGVDQDIIEKVIVKLKDLGMAVEEDCEYVEESFLTDILKPIQVKKLLSFFAKFCSERTAASQPVIYNVDFVESNNLLISKSPIPMQFSSSSDIHDSCANPSVPSDINDSCVNPFVPSTSQSFQFMQLINKNWAENFNVPWDLFPKEVLEACEKKTRLRKCIYSEMIRLVAEKISRFNPSPGRKFLKIIAKKFTQKYPATFEDRCGDTIVADGGTTLAIKLGTCLENRQRRKGFSDLFEVESEKSIKKTVRNSYGCCNWQPNELPQGETKASQMAHKNWLFSESRKLLRDESKIKELMQVTYASQRCIVNSKNSVKIIKEEWPMLFENNFFTAHASTLLGIVEIADKICKNIDIKGNIIYNYMNCNFKKDSIFECLKTINTAKELGCKDAETLGAILIIPAYFGEEQEELFQINMDPVSSKDVETNNSKLTPFIATSGGNVFTAGEYFIVIDGIVSLRTNEFRLAVSLCILSFFVFNIEYPQKAALTLEFIQRIFANINPDKGSKAPRRKGKRNNMVAKPVINLVNRLRDFESHFNL